MGFKDSAVYQKFDHKFKDKILKYMEAMYLQSSDLNHIDDPHDKRKRACIKAGLDFSEKWVLEMSNLSDEDLNTIIFHFINYNNTNRYTNFLANQQLLWRVQGELMKEFKMDDDLKDFQLKITLSEKSEQLLERVENQKKLIYKSDAEIKMAEKQVQAISVEQRIKRK
jgi:hypothetical protein